MLPDGSGEVTYQKTKLDDGGVVSDALLFRFKLNGHPDTVLVVDSRCTDVQVIETRDKLLKVIKGEVVCLECKWPIEAPRGIVLYTDGVRDGWECYCTFERRKAA